MTFTNDPPVIDPRLLEAGGSLALSIDGLTGDAADAQDPKTHASTHESGAVDVLDAQALANFNHAANHALTGGDSLSVEALDFAGADGEVLSVSGGSLSFETISGGISESDAIALNELLNF
jgi:hypothetical protein